MNMTKKTDLFGELKERGLVYQMTPDLEEAAEKGLTLYWGIDPTGDSMHVGHFLGVMTARRFLKAGHKVIVLVGGGTSMIGDPSGKNEERPILPKETIEENKRKLKKLIEKLLGVKEGTVTMVDNADWLEKISLIDFLREVGKHMPISAMLGKEMVKTRMDSEAGISYAEFSYQLLQAYDFFVLIEKFGCNLQIGGSDQWGNIITGVDLIRKKTGKQAFGMSFPLVVDPKTGRKFGKSERGASIWLETQKTHPFLLFQFFMNTSDDLIPLLVNFYSFKTKIDIDRMVVSWEKNKESRLLQRELATEVLSIVHGEIITKECLRVASILFEKGKEAMTLSDLEFVQGALPTISLPKGENFIPEKHLVDLGLAASKSEATRLAKQMGVYTEELFGKYILVRKGKKDYGLIKMI
jgi:tyrosyl-tRNA synthetase